MFDSFSVYSKVRGTYSIHFIDNLQEQLNSSAETGNSVFIIDQNIKKYFGDKMDAIFSAKRFVIINCKEENKTIDYSQKIIRELISANIRTNDSLIVIGGGIAQDIGAFIASILFRGIDWKFYPTTLLAQCDSCIGSKSSINFDKFKNLIGTFNPPSEIFIYSQFLETLSESEIRSGIGEMLHYYFTEGIDLAQKISAQFEQLLQNRSLLPYFINHSLRIKKKIIEIDEFDKSIRHIFNYGHTFGHAIEAITNYQIPHGQAISIGMDIANFISVSKNMISKNQFMEMHNILIKNIPPFKIIPENIDEYLAALSRDKKNKKKLLGCILTRGAGNMEKVFLELDEPIKNILLNYSSMYGVS